MLGSGLLKDIDRERRHAHAPRAQQDLAKIRAAAEAENKQLLVTIQAIRHVPLGAEGDTLARRASLGLTAYEGWREAMDRHLEQARQIRLEDSVSTPVWRLKSLRQVVATVFAVGGATWLLVGDNGTECAAGWFLMTCSAALLAALAFGDGCFMTVVGTATLTLVAWKGRSIGDWADDTRPWPVVGSLLLICVLGVLAERRVPQEPPWRRARERQRNPHAW
ncbi:hypothetical protein GCM10010449_64470 [Streptomyces rectiviolaceus]|uniref:Integral membrane protein n=2 Tax=Streptomyces rectiviolaceus TaxID=332591 RepID=A0ABP6N333_9ACTN